MKNRDQARLASILILLAGIWIAISPIWISVTGAALVSLIIAGIVVGLAGIVQFSSESSVPSLITGIAAVWIFLSAFIFGVASSAVWNQVVMAIVALVLATWDGSEITEFHRQHRPISPGSPQPHA